MDKLLKWNEELLRENEMLKNKVQSLLTEILNLQEITKNLHRKSKLGVSGDYSVIQGGD